MGKATIPCLKPCTLTSIGGNGVSMIIPRTQYKQFQQFCKENAHVCEHLRLGQAFYNWANCHKMTQTPWLQRLYYVDDVTAEKMISSIIDEGN